MKIQAEKLCKTFAMKHREVSVIADLAVTIDHGRFACLLGPSGCGKSTFLRCVAGLDVPTSGTLLLDGVPVRGPGPDRSMVFQDYALFPWYTVEQNIQFGLRARRNKALRKRNIAYTTRELIELVGLTGFEHAYPHQISGGMRQRVGIARGLAVEPGALLMDEPFAAIDAITREGLQDQLVKVWAKTDKTILFVTHSVDEAAILADEVHVFAPRPTSIVETVPVDLPRPRDKTSPEFIAVVARLRQAIDAAMRLGGEVAA